MNEPNAAYAVKNWDRRRWDSQPDTEIPAANLYRTEMIRTYTGVIEGEGSAQFLFADNREGCGSFLALERVTGSVGGRTGSFVLQHSGSFANGKATVTMVVLPALSTGELTGLSGQSIMQFSEHLDVYPLYFEYRFEEQPG